MFGRGAAFQPPPPEFPTNTAAALALASQVDRQADQALAEGRFAAADRFGHLAAELKARAAAGRRA